MVAINLYINESLNSETSKRVDSFKIEDNSENSLDSLELSILNHDYSISPPKTKATIEVEVEETKMGRFLVQFVETSEGIIHLQGISQDLSKARVRQTRVFKEKPLGDVLNTISGELGVSLQVSPQLKSKKINYYLQDNKTNLEVIMELGEIFFAIANIKDKNLVFVSKDNKKYVDILENDILNICIKDAGHKLYEGALSNSWDFEKAKTISKKQGKAPYFHINTVLDKSLQEELINSKYKELQEKEIISISMIGNPNLQAGFHFKLGNIDSKYQDFKGEYRISQSIHTLGNTYSTRISAVKVYNK